MRSGNLWRFFLAGLTAVVVLCAAPAARADLNPFWLPQGDKPGPWMLNFKIGGAFGAYYYYGAGGPDSFVMEFEAGYALDRQRNAYLKFPVQFEFSPGLTTIMLPVGFQYDIQMPLKGLYIYPAFSVGFAASIFSDGYLYDYCNYGGAVNYCGGTSVAGFIMPEFGAKYVLKGRLNFGLELFSLPIFFNGDGAFVQYRILTYAGINL